MEWFLYGMTRTQEVIIILTIMVGAIVAVVIHTIIQRKRGNKIARGKSKPVIVELNTHKAILDLIDMIRDMITDEEVPAKYKIRLGEIIINSGYRVKK